MKPPLKMEAQSLPEPALLGRLACGRSSAAGVRPRSRRGIPGPRQEDLEGPAGHPRRGVAPQLQADVTGARERAFAGLSRRYLMRTSRLKRMFCAGACFSAPPFPRE